MSQIDIDADPNHGTNNFIKEEPLLMYDSKNALKTDSESHNDVACDEKLISQASKETLCSLNLDNIKYENIDESSSLSSSVDQDLKPNVSNHSLCLLDSQMCQIKESQSHVKKEDTSSFKQNVSVIGLGFEDEKFEIYDSQEIEETKFDASAKCDCYKKNKDTNFDWKSDINVLVKSEVDDNADSNKTDWDLSENMKFTTATDEGNIVCQCKKINNKIKLENISTLNQNSYLAQDTDWNKSISAVDLPSVHSDHTKVEESSCDYHALLIQRNLSNNEDSSIERKQGITILSNIHVFEANQDLFFESSSSVHTPYSQPHIDISCKKSSYLAMQKSSKSQLTKDEIIRKCLKPFRCSECSKYFAKKSTLKQHEIIHQCLKPFKCSKCSKCFTRKSELAWHKNFHKRLKSFKCLECSKCFTRKSTLKQHERIHQGLKPFKCSECANCFHRKADLGHHENTHKDLTPFQCLECSECFTKKSSLKQHEQIHQGLKPFKCSDCSKSFICKSHLTRHENIHKGLKPFKCSECSKSFTQKHHLKAHEKTHQGLNPLQCSECSICFTQKQDLALHEIIHKGLKRFQCLECSKFFTHKSTLKRHERIHQDLKPFECSECSKCFTQKSNLKQHELIHQGLKPFKCSKCSKCFTRKSDLALHEIIHKGFKPFQCLECSKCFTKKTTLKRHERIHQGVKFLNTQKCLNASPKSII